MSTDNFKFVLCSPQMGENIGATARVMNNFGFNSLRIVTPRDGWPNDKASEMATASARHIIESAEVYEDMSAAVADCRLVYATTARSRDIKKAVLYSNQLQKQPKFSAETNIAILFGREKFGLTNEELILANYIITIPTFSAYFSLNIAQAVTVIAYELSLAINNHPDETVKNLDIASKEELINFLNYLMMSLEDTTFFKVADKTELMQQRIKHMFSKAKFSSQEIRTVWGIIKALKG